MTTHGFPEFIQNLPEADLPVSGVCGWLLNGDNGQILFIQANVTTRIPEHMHGDQWGIVVEGEIELTIGEKTGIYHRGDSYYIPEGTPHKAVLYKGFRALDIFADKDRYQIKS